MGEHETFLCCMGGSVLHTREYTITSLQNTPEERLVGRSGPRHTRKSVCLGGGGVDDDDGET